MRYSGEFSSSTFTYQVTVDDDVYDGQVLRNRLTNTVDNPGAKPVRMSEFVEVVEAGEPAAVTVHKLRDARQPDKDGLVVFKRPRSAVGERLTVDYGTRGSAERGRHFRGLDGAVTFVADARRAREYVRVINRKGRQDTRVVSVVLREADGYVVGDPSRARVRILEQRRNRR